MSRTLRLLALLVIACSGLFVGPAGAVTLRQVGTFDEPVFVAAPPRDLHLVFVVERRGRLRVIADGRVQRRPFLDITRMVSQPPNMTDERGLLSMAFAPDYANTGRFYVAYTRRRGDRDDLNWLVVDEYRSSGAGATVARPGSRRRIFMVPTGRMHFGGQLAFGPDGKLWIGTGDGRGPGDPNRQGQNRRTLRGKLLRIDPRPGVRLAPRGNPYRPPSGSQFVWSYGLRNPFRFSFDRLTGDLAIGDVGQNFAEEIDVVTKASGLGRGANFGWSLLEGHFRFDESSPTRLRPSAIGKRLGGYVAPAIEHLHRAGWCAITGGYVVRDPELPALEGRYVYGDFCRGVINAATITPTGRATRVRSTGLRVELLSSFGEDGCGRVYAASLRGPVYRLTQSGRCGGPAPLPFRVPSGPSSPQTAGGWWPVHIPWVSAIWSTARAAGAVGAP